MSKRITLVIALSLFALSAAPLVSSIFGIAGSTAEAASKKMKKRGVKGKSGYNYQYNPSQSYTPSSQYNKR